ncbi:hypothetical protein BT96DRAFT_393848 [Gymnopus androsaceus JB14]|uniref:Uncharacterized protein n=1 Tax=Gymnopus androsaceus JB14 TaxID=1447944 RepID=A0A6A4GX29_9AGAR|nr:hypothetical protein BT96DRAFT_393848 [Gymnopus androsaceus JB14]
MIIVRLVPFWLHTLLTKHHIPSFTPSFSFLLINLQSLCIRHPVPVLQGIAAMVIVAEAVTMDVLSEGMLERTTGMGTQTIATFFMY